MYDHRASLSYEEKMALIEEHGFSDVESEGSSSSSSNHVPPYRSNIFSAWSRPAAKSSLRVKEWASSFRFNISDVPTPPLPAWTSFLWRALIFLLPSFTHRLFQRTPLSSDRIPRKPGPTAYLDGMRGLAALFVCHCHYFYGAYQIATGWGQDHANYDFWRLPFVRLLYAGPTMVCVFFVVSGYALSLKPMKQIRGRAWDGLSQTMASFTFRRAFRLYLPPTVSTLTILALVRLGAYEGTREFAGDPEFMRNVMEPHGVDLEPTTWLQLKSWGWDWFEFVQVFGNDRFPYDVHLWTIPLEFRCSMVLFLTLFGTSRLRTGARFFVVALLAWFALRYNHWGMVLFFAGVIFAELDLIRGVFEPAPSSTTHRGAFLPVDEEQMKKNVSGSWSQLGSKVMTGAWTLTGVLALYLMSAPDSGCDATPGYMTLGLYIPEWFDEKYRWWQAWGSILFVFCTARSPLWQRFFTTPVVQYFGHISYAIYLVHNFAIHTLGYAVQQWAFSLTGTEPGMFNNGAALAAVINIPIVIWVADIFWRAVDAPIVRFTKWLEGRLIVQE